MNTHDVGQGIVHGWAIFTVMGRGPLEQNTSVPGSEPSNQADFAWPRNGVCVDTLECYEVIYGAGLELMCF